ncbi:MAG: GDP-mannose 4,6-dehydratase, partial [Candidatus Omnitrophota bacterium]
GPYQYPEKVIPLFVTNALENKKLPLYGDGLNVRDWLYVLDNCRAIDLILHKGEIGRIYNVAAGNEKTNLQLTKLILKILQKPEDLIEYVNDRPGHDRRYSMDSSKIKGLGWQPQYQLQEALKETINWYQNNKQWWKE